MSKKPSEIIKDIAYDLSKRRFGSIQYGSDFTIAAILNYLDQQWEKEQPCKHNEHCCVCLKCNGHALPPSFCNIHKTIGRGLN